MTEKTTYFIRLSENGRTGVGECALFKGLSSDDRPGYEDKLTEVCHDLFEGIDPDLREWSSIRFGVESAMADLKSKWDPSDWEKGQTMIKINGLVWMDTVDKMIESIQAKIDDGFTCIKLKIGGERFDDELKMLHAIRRTFSANEIEIRLDANGAFSPEEALHKLDVLSKFDIHSIEQPIKARQYDSMAEICRLSPIDIALDEELIGVYKLSDKAGLLDKIRPKYIILKPALCGGLSGADEWISLASNYGNGWWATSALESNVGLNAIARWLTGSHQITMPQGLGTGQIYVNNIESPLFLDGDMLGYKPDKQFVFPELSWT